MKATMAQRNSSWRSIAAGVCLFLALLGLLQTFQDFEAGRMAGAGLDYLLGRLTPSIVFAGLAIFFFFRERAYRKRKESETK
jgi:hypothetical protein